MFIWDLFFLNLNWHRLTDDLLGFRVRVNLFICINLPSYLCVCEWVSVHYLLHHWISWSSWQLLPGLQSPAPRPDLHGRHKQTDRHCLARAKQTLTSHQHWIKWGTFYARSALSTCDGSVHPRHRTLNPAVHLIYKNQEEVQTPDNDPNPNPDQRESNDSVPHTAHTVHSTVTSNFAWEIIF